VEILPFIWVIMLVIQELHLQPAFDVLLESLVKTAHVHFVPLYVEETSLVEEEFTDVAEYIVVVPEFGSALYSILSLHVN
jgi:hypothetical protein